MIGAQRIVDRLGGFFVDPCNRTGLIIVAALLVPLAFLALTHDLAYAIGYPYRSLFYNPGDRFADLLKSAMSYDAVMSGVDEGGKLQNWPDLYRTYFHTRASYYGVPLSHYNMMPLASLVQIGFGIVVAASDPSTALAAAIALYGAGACGVAFLFRRFWPGSSAEIYAILAAFLLSYPALFMVTRGNMLAGYTTLGLAFYAVTAIKGSWRWFGLFCLAVAVNLRPNTAVFGLLELAVATRWLDRFRSVAGLSGMTLMLGVVSYWIVQSYDVHYTWANFRHAYEVYIWAYAQGGMGEEWNFSLYGATRFFRDWLNLSPSYNDACYSVVSMMAMLAAALSVGLALLKRLNAVTALFISASLSALFTPVFAFYHMTEFAVPLLACLSVLGRQSPTPPATMLVFVTCLLCLCPLEAQYTFYAAVMSVALVAVMERAMIREPAP